MVSTFKFKKVLPFQDGQLASGHRNISPGLGPSAKEKLFENCGKWCAIASNPTPNLKKR